MIKLTSLSFGLRELAEILRDCRMRKMPMNCFSTVHVTSIITSKLVWMAVMHFAAPEQDSDCLKISSGIPAFSLP